MGFFAGGGAYRTRFGFRHLPYASRIQARAGYATGARTGRFDMSLAFHRSNSKVRMEVAARASGIEVMRYHGLGNEISLTGPDDNEYYRVNHTQYSLSPTLVVPLSEDVEVESGVSMRYSNTLRQTGRFLETVPDLYGSGGFGRLGWSGRLKVDTRDVPAAASRGVRVELGGSVYPGLWDVLETYGEVNGEISSYLSAMDFPLRPTLAVRTGARKLLGGYPFQDAAFIGDASTVRLGRQNRYGGDAAVYGSAELRVRLSRVFFVLPGSVGVFALGDLGRVYLDGETSDRWHNAAGGGVWVSFLGAANTLSVAVARSEVGTTLPQRTSVYVQGGFAF